jgi:hypothetical protein
MLEEALHYESMGLSVIPVHSIRDGRCSCGSARCKSPGKHPRIAWRSAQSRKMTEEGIRAYWDENPDCNVGIVTGPISGIMIVDIDGEIGLRSLEEVGMGIDDLPATPSVKTGGGGIHLYFRYPESGHVKTVAGILPKVDIRAAGGFVVAPPSRHISGGEYAWVEGRSLEDLPLADVDLSLLLSPEAPKKERSSHAWFESLISGVKKGGRNQSATRLAGRYLSRGLTIEETTLILQAWNERNTPPMNKKEIDSIVESVSKSEERSGLEWVSERLRVNVKSIRRITGDEPKVIIDFDEGTCVVTTAQLLSPIALQTAIADATKIIIPKRSPKSNPTHEQLAQAILQASVDEDAGHEATWVGEIQSLIRDYVAHQRLVPEISDGEDIPISGPFRKDGVMWVSLLDLVQRSSSRWGVRVHNTTQMAQRMRSIGLQPKSFRSVDGEMRSMWGIGEEI